MRPTAVLEPLMRRTPLAGLLTFSLAAVLFAAPAPAAASNGDRVSFGDDVTVKAGEEISGDLVVFGGDAKVYGHVDGNAVVMGGDLYVAPAGEVDGDTVDFGGSIDNESTISPSGHHRGSTVKPARPIPPIPEISPIPNPEPIVPAVPDQSTEDHGPATGWIGYLIACGILSLLAFALMPNAVRTVRDELVQRPIVGSVIGLSWPFIFTAIIIALAITVIGIVVMPAAVVAVAVAYLIGRAAVGLLLGRSLFEVAKVVEPAPLATAAVGIVIITVLEAVVPLWMGILIEALVGSIAIGAATLPFLHQRKYAIAGPATYMPPPQAVFTPPSPPPPPGPPAVPQ
jgi:hypothetical protein